MPSVAWSTFYLFTQHALLNKKRLFQPTRLCILKILSTFAGKSFILHPKKVFHPASLILYPNVFACKGTKNFQYTQACRLKKLFFIQQSVLRK